MSRRRKARGPMASAGYGGNGRSGAVHLGDVTTASADDVRLIRTGEVIDMGDISGERREAVTASFVFFGERLRVNPDLTEIAIIDLLETAEGIDVNDARSLTITKEYARAHIHPDDFDRFWSAVRANRQDSAAIMVTCGKILSGITANPTGGRSDSSAGQPVTRTSSPPTSSGPVTDLGEARDSRRSAYVRQIELLEQARDAEGQPIPVNAAIACQIIEHARTQGIDLTPDLSRSVAATA
jgi:hypothetical protein